MRASGDASATREQRHCCRAATLLRNRGRRRQCLADPNGPRTIAEHHDVPKATCPHRYHLAVPHLLSPTPRSLARIVALATAAIMALGACAGDRTSAAGDRPQLTTGQDRPDGDLTDAGDASGSAADTTAPSTTEPRSPLGSGQTVTIAFAGDASFEGLTDRLLTNPTGLLSAVSPLLSAADVTMVNLEAALGIAGSPEAKAFNFRVPAEALVALDSAGVDVVTMANNHGMDYGPEGLQESLRIRVDTGFPILGIGQDDDEAYEPWIIEVKGQRIGFIAANDIFDAHLVTRWSAAPGHPGVASTEEPFQEQFAERVRATRPDVDTLVVYLHFGTETQTCPNARQTELVDLLTDAGADIVVGSHTHRLQGMGYRGDRFVAYGLSNFVFNAPSAPGRRSGVLTVSATGRRVDGYEWDPVSIQNRLPVPLTGAAADAERQAMDDLQACTGLSSTPDRAPDPATGRAPDEPDQPDEADREG